MPAGIRTTHRSIALCAIRAINRMWQNMGESQNIVVQLILKEFLSKLNLLQINSFSYFEIMIFNSLPHLSIFKVKRSKISIQIAKLK